MTDAIWVVVANQAGASIYNASQRGKVISVIDEFMHEAGRVHFQELVSDGPGRVHDRKGAARHSMEADVGPQQESIKRFARNIVTYLETATAQDKFRSLILIAAPAFLGEIRKHIPQQLGERIVREIPKDLVGNTADQIQALLNP